MIKPFEITNAINLLRADLEWSDDFDAIRDSLSNLLEAINWQSGEFVKEISPELADLVSDLTDDGLQPSGKADA